MHHVALQVRCNKRAGGRPRDHEVASASVSPRHHGRGNPELRWLRTMARSADRRMNGRAAKGDDMERGLDSREGTGRSLLNLAAAAVIALSATACTAASLSPSAGGAGASGSASPTTTGTSVVPTAIATPTQTPTTSLRSPGGVSSGTWTGLDWAAVPTGLAPAVPPVAANGYYPNAILEGWSKGYVELLWDPKLRTATPWVSADGLSWQVGSKLDTNVWLADMKAFDQENVDLSADCSLRIRHFEEGPETLLMTAYFICPVACGNGIVGRDATWTSSDGLSWMPLDRPKTFGSSGVGAISGGSSGFVALGGTSDGRILWLSADGQNWKHGALPADARATGAEAYDPAAVAGGFVLPGACFSPPTLPCTAVAAPAFCRMTYLSTRERCGGRRTVSIGPERAWRVSARDLTSR